MAIGHADRQGYKSYISIPRYTTVERKRDEEDRVTTRVVYIAVQICIGSNDDRDSHNGMRDLGL